MFFKTDNGSKTQLDKVVFSDALIPHFDVSDGEASVLYSFEYTGKLPIKKWDFCSVEVFLLDSFYKNAENDIFQINISGIEGRVGWIFPIIALESNEHDFAEHDVFNSYRLAVYENLLRRHIDVDRSLLETSPKLSDIYKSKTILVLHKETLDGSNFEIEDYLVSLYRYGYLLSQDDQKGPNLLNLYDNLFVNDNGYKNIILSKSNVNIKSDSFMRSLFEQGLIRQDNYLLRFFFLYQLIEHLMTVEFESRVNDSIKEYQDKKIQIGDLREAITARKERTLISYILESSEIDKHWESLFLEKQKSICKSMGLSLEPGLNVAIYKLRNIIVHSLRHTISEKEKIEETVNIFEQIIIDILISYKK